MNKKNKRIVGQVRPILKLDRTLTKDGYAADAKVTGEQIANLSTATNARLNELTAMRNTSGLKKYNATVDGKISLQIISNGFAATITVVINETLPQGYKYVYEGVPVDFAPANPGVWLDNTVECGFITFGKKTNEDKTQLVIDCENHGNGYVAGSFDDMFVQSYALANPYNEELGDIRVGADGTTYETAGKAVREQIGKVDSKFRDVSRWIVDYDPETNTADLTSVEIAEHVLGGGGYEGGTAFLEKTITNGDIYVGMSFYTFAGVEVADDKRLVVFSGVDEQGNIQFAKIDEEGKVTFSTIENGGGGTGGDVPAMGEIVEAVLAALPNGDEVEY